MMRPRARKLFRVRPNSILLLALGLTWAACDDTSGPGDEDGTLVVSTATVGNEPDVDGYRLEVDGVVALRLDPTATADVILLAGPHRVALVGVAEHCSVLPGASLDVEVVPRGSTSVAFEINCAVTGARITITTTGLDPDPDGYRVEVDGADRATIPANGSALLALAPGSRIIGLAGLAPNCTPEGPATREVTIVGNEALPIDFAIVCTATSGLIRVVIEAAGTDVEGSYKATVDGAKSFDVERTGGANLIPVPAGDHVVSLLAPSNCAVETEPQSVTVSSGGLVRDTVEVTFAVTCVRAFATLQIIARTTGTIPQVEYIAWGCPLSGQYCWDWLVGPLGRLGPNDTLNARAPLSVRRVELTGVPGNCSVQGSNPSSRFTLTPGGTHTIEFGVACSP
jgi:hypothetical protein